MQPIRHLLKQVLQLGLQLGLQQVGQVEALVRELEQVPGQCLGLAELLPLLQRMHQMKALPTACWSHPAGGHACTAEVQMQWNLVRGA